MVGTTVILLSRFIEIRLIIISYFKLVNAPLKHISNMNQAIYFLIKKFLGGIRKNQYQGQYFCFVYLIHAIKSKERGLKVICLTLDTT